MSAIAGIYHLDGQPLNKERLAKIMTAQKAYGADGGSVWHGDGVGLGHQMTVVTHRLQDERLPWHEGAYAITADARIDNRKQLFDALGIRGQERGMPDSQLIVRAYQKWGTDCPTHLLGDFAFAIWDGRKRQLFVARDIIGIKPFYYYHHATSKQVLFASDIEAVLAAPQLAYTLNTSFLAVHLAHGWGAWEAELTCWQQIKKLPPAHAMTISPLGIKKWSYWTPAEGQRLRLKSEDEYAEMLVEILKEAVRCRVPSAPLGRKPPPLGSHLSGGLGSSCVTVLAARQMREVNQPLTAFSWSPPPAPAPSPQGTRDWEGNRDMSQDERAFVKAVAEQESLPYHFTSLTERDILRHRLRRFDQAQGGLSSEAVVRQRANQLGIRVLLSGAGLNQMMHYHGHGYLPDLFWRGQWRHMLSQLQDYATLQKGDIYRTTYNKLLLPLLPDTLYFSWQRLRGRLRTTPSRLEQSNVLTWLKPDLSRQIRQSDLPPPILGREQTGVHRYRLARFMSGRLAKYAEGWAAAGAPLGFAYRYPLLDRRVIEFSFSLPPEMLMKGGWRRYLFCHAMRGILPDNVRWTKKKYGLVPQRVRLSEAWQIEHLFPILSARLSDSQPFHYLDQKRISDMLTYYAGGGEGREKRSGLLTALQIELMQNHALAEEIKSLTSQQTRT